MLTGLVAVAWYGLVFISGYWRSDFTLSQPRLEEYLTALKAVPGMLLLPYSFHGIWYILLGVLIWRRPSLRRGSDATIFWLLPLLYAGVMLITYLFSNWVDIQHHINTSYYRLLLQVTPLVMVYLARTLAAPVSAEASAADVA